jgi:phosphopantetheinyl transferase
VDFAALHEHRDLRLLDFAKPQEAPRTPPLAIELPIHLDTLSLHREAKPAPDSIAFTDEPSPLSPPSDLPVLGKVTHCIAGKELVLERVLSLDEDLFLHDHTFVSSGSKPVAERIAIVPLTMSLEFAAEAASVLAPEMVLVGFENVRGRRWIHVTGVGQELLRIDVYREQSDRDTSERRFRVTLTFDGNTCFTADVLFATVYPSCSQGNFADPGDAGAWPFTPEQIYDERIMFHGPRFHGITNLGQMGNPASTAILTVLPKDQLFASKPSPVLLSDPCLLDAMGQTFGLWAAAHGEIILPIGVERIEFFRPPAEPGQELLLRLEVTAYDPDTRQIRCNMQAEDASGNVHIRMRGWTDWMLNWPENYVHSIRLPEYYTLAREVTLPGMPEDAVCTMVRREDFKNIDRSWAAAHFLHQQECSALAALSTAEGGDASQHDRDLVYGLAGSKDAIRLWWARRSGGAMPHPSDFCINHDAAGQPYLEPAGDPSLPRISCAHSEGAFVTIAAEGACGVDIEPASRDADGILSQFASAEEIALLDQLAAVEPEQLWALRLWCAKEAVSKVLGTGFQGQPKAFQAIDGDPSGGFLMAHLPTGRRFVVYTSRLEDYIMAYTSASLAIAMTEDLSSTSANSTVSLSSATGEQL